MTNTTPPFSEAPNIATPRLLLRAHRADDFPACSAMWSDPRITRYTIGEPASAQRTWMRILGYRGHWALLGFGYWAVEEKASGDFVGELGFADFKRGIDPAIDGVPEMGWALSAHVHGRGFATEALRAVSAWGDSHFTSPRTVCLINPDNPASLRVAAKLGFREFARKPRNGEVDILLERLRPRAPGE